ncbi:SagB/ThcOx family dehydrogenase [Candidatus Gracilibacteria bacterium]|nr:SagB/ThcOx family dehydrogenase [Candidatus Gracilibacteria bacterium]
MEKSPIAFKKLAKILYSMTEVEGIKTHASAGGLYPLSLYFHTFYDTEILPKGTYKYHNQSHKAIPQKTLLIEYLINAMSNETDLDSGIIIFIVANLGIHSQKYFNRGYRFTMQEAGMVVQNAYLSCSEQNLGICQYGAYDENILSQMLELPSNYEVVGVLRIGEICTSDETEVVNTKTQHQIDYLGGEIQNSDLQIRQLTCEGNRMGYWGTSVKFCYRDNLSAYANGVSYSREISQLKAMAEMHERICSGNITNTITAKARELSGKWYNPSLYFPLKKEYLDSVGFVEFSVNLERRWVKGYRLNTNDSIWIPIDCVYYPLPKDYTPCFGVSSNGVATGQTLENAVFAALMELIERDAIMVSWYSQCKVKRLSTNLLDPYLLSKAEFWEKLGRKLEFYNFTLDSVPVIVAVIHGEHYPMFVRGSSANPDYLKAAHKACQEVEITMHSLLHSENCHPILPEDVVEVEDHGRLYYFTENQERLWQFYDAEVTDVAPVVINDPYQRFDPIIINLHKPKNNLDLPVVRVLHEDLLHINFGFGNEHIGHSRLDKLGLKWVFKYPAFPHYII